MSGMTGVEGVAAHLILNEFGLIDPTRFDRVPEIVLRCLYQTWEFAMDLATRATSEELSRALGDAVVRIWGQLPHDV
jgi:hypothetical protein